MEEDEGPLVVSHLRFSLAALAIVVALNVVQWLSERSTVRAARSTAQRA